MQKAAPTLEEVLKTAQAEGWIDADEAAAFRRHHSDSSVETVIKSIADECGIRLTRAITARLTRQ